MTLLLALLKDRDGNAATEFALLLPLVLLIVAGIADFGFAIRSKLQLQSAVTTGLQYVMRTQGQDVQRAHDIIAHEMGQTPADIEVKAACECKGIEKTCTTSCTDGMQRFVTAHVTELANTGMFWPDQTFSADFHVFTGTLQ